MEHLRLPQGGIDVSNWVFSESINTINTSNTVNKMLCLTPYSKALTYILRKIT